MTEILNVYKDLFTGYWWVITPVALFLFLRHYWLEYLVDKFLKGLEWVVLEIRFPREAVKSPKAMEQIFSGLHAVERTPKFKDIYLKGELPPWFNIEIISDGGIIRILIRAQKKHRNLVESLIYAQYPEAEIFETEDYINNLPADIPNKDYDIWGTELILTQSDGYPIRTYPFFFQEKEIEERTDPIAGLFEFLSSLDPKEHVWLQILISPTGDGWKKDGERLVAKLVGKEVKVSGKDLIVVEETKNWAEAFVKGVSDFFFGPGAEKKEEEKKVGAALSDLTPGQREVVLAVEANIAKLGFKTMIRELYWAHKDVFSRDKTAAVGGFFKQFNTQNLNGFRPNQKITPGWSKIFRKRREPNQKRYLVKAYKNRHFFFNKPSRWFVFNTEELATIFHIPLKYVGIERIPRTEAKKGSPPGELPII